MRQGYFDLFPCVKQYFSAVTYFQQSFSVKLDIWGVRYRLGRNIKHSADAFDERRLFFVGEQLLFGSAGLGASATSLTFWTDRRIRKCSHVSKWRGIGIFLKTFDNCGYIARGDFFTHALDPFPE